jgi:hypothetical protein
VQPEEVLELIGSAPQRYDTVRAALRYRGDGPTKKEIRERIVRTEAGRRAFRISLGKPPRGPCALSTTRSLTDPSGGAPGRGTQTSSTGVWSPTGLTAG